MIMQYLEPRQFETNDIIYNELETVSELYFVMEGRFDIGYIINREAKYRLQFGDRAVIGGFNLVYDKRIV